MRLFSFFRRTPAPPDTTRLACPRERLAPTPAQMLKRIGEVRLKSRSSIPIFVTAKALRTRKRKPTWSKAEAEMMRAAA